MLPDKTLQGDSTKLQLSCVSTFTHNIWTNPFWKEKNSPWSYNISKIRVHPVSSDLLWNKSKLPVCSKCDKLFYFSPINDVTFLPRTTRTNSWIIHRVPCFFNAVLLTSSSRGWQSPEPLEKHMAESRLGWTSRTGLIQSRVVFDPDVRALRCDLRLI